ncbi:MAG TPA: EamA family transporter [Candidatus Bathyarchaeia archaeon]|nr:EamA family transporter [Candidatus Bathyarchaeia archaeon]
MDVSISFALLAACCLGCSDFVAKLSTHKIGYLRTALLMQYVGIAFLLLIAFRDLPLLWEYSAVTRFALVLGIVNAVGTVALFKSFEVGQLSIVSPVASSYPALSIVLAVFLLNESISVIRFSGILAIMVGILLVSLQKSKASKTRHISAGIWYALIAFTCQGFLFFGLKWVVGDLGSFLPVLLLRLVTALVLTGAVVVVGGRSVAHNSTSFMLVGFIGIVDTLGNVAFTMGLGTGAVAVVSTITALFSSVTVLLACLLLKERLVMHQAIGFLAIMLGVGIVSYFT